MYSSITINRVDHFSLLKKEENANKSDLLILKDKIKVLEKKCQIQQTDLVLLKKQNELILKRTESLADKSKTFKYISKEVKALFSFHGYSETLGTNNLFKKILWFFCFTALFVSCMNLVVRNVQSFLSYDVVTQIQIKEDTTPEFPAITFCLVEDEADSNQKLTPISRNLSSSKVVECFFENTKNIFRIEHFEHGRIYSAVFDTNYSCFTFNSGRNNANIFRVGSQWKHFLSL